MRLTRIIFNFFVYLSHIKNDSESWSREEERMIVNPVQKNYLEFIHLHSKMMILTLCFVIVLLVTMTSVSC